MDWKGYRESKNVEDRRGNTGKYVVGGGIGTILVAAVIYFLGGDPSQFLNESALSPVNSYAYAEEQNLNDERKKFVNAVLASTEDVWTTKFSEIGRRYIPPKLVLFSGRTLSECGGASSSTGPFYCPADKKVYLDLSFFNEMAQQFNVKGEFAYAYVITHEIGHHVQDLLGITNKVTQLQSQTNEAEANRLSVMLELQADFLAGYWAHYAQKDFNLTQSDIKAAIIAANAIGDDRLQKQTQGYIIPDSFTHGTSEQRMNWFIKGFQSGDLKLSNTFNNSSL